MNFWSLNEKYSNHIAVYTENGQALTYSQLHQYVLQHAAFLSKQKTLAFLLCDNNISSLTMYLSFLQQKIPVALVSSNLPLEQLDYLIEHYMPQYIWIPQSINVEYIQQYIETHRDENYKLLERKEISTTCVSDQLALLLSTSGSTGSPKFVRLSYNNISHNANSIMEYLKIQVQDRMITTLPMNYTYGLSCIHSHLLAGASIVLSSHSVIERTFWDLIKQYKVTNFAGVPFIYEMLLKIRFYQQEIPSLKWLTQAGGKLNTNSMSEIIDQCNQKNIQFITMYGQTEATARMSYLPYEHLQNKIGSIGIPIPGGTFHLVDDNHNEISECHTVGELVYSGENVSLGYAVTPEDLSKGDENKGILYTGDMATVDEDGFYYIVGRKNRFLKLFGHRINLDEVEQLLAKQGITAACAGTDEKLLIFIDDPNIKEAILPFITKFTKLNASAFRINIVDQIPRNESGKLIYNQLPSF